jgi:carboxyl-terminal processing protease
MRKCLRWIYLVVALAAIAGALFLGCHPLVRAAQNASGVSEVSQEKRAQAALETLYILKNFYLYPADEHVLIKAYEQEQSIQDMIKALDDPLARFMNEAEFRTFMEDMKGSFDGIGIVVGILDGELTIVAPIKDTPGERGGLMSLDKIRHIDGRTTEDMALEYAVSLMKGPKGTTVVLGIERTENETTRAFDVSIVRDTIRIPRTSCKMQEDQIGYVHLASFFGENTAETMMEEIKSLFDQDMKGLILDLRLNTGGSVDLAVQVSTKFLPAGTPVVHMVDKSGRRVTYHAGPGEKVDIPLVVLVDEVSASASEIVAGALKDMGRATIVGVKTFGKGSVQTIYPLSDGSAISITTHKYLTAGEHSIDKRGIEPDVEVELPEAPEDSKDSVTDTQLEAAIKILKEQLEKEESNKVAG